MFVSQSKRRTEALQQWHGKGGVLLVGYELFRSMVEAGGDDVDLKRLLCNPGPDVVRPALMPLRRLLHPPPYNQVAR